MLTLSHCHSRRISLIRRLLKTAHHESLHFSNAVKATVHLCCPVGFLTHQRTHILVSNTNLWKQVSCCASEPNNLSLKFCSLSHSADTTVLSVRVPTSLPTQLGSALELSWKGILSERTFMGVFFIIMFSEQTHSNVSHCLHKLQFCFFPSNLFSIYTSFIAIFKIWPESTMSHTLLIHFPHSRVFCVQNVT